MPVRNWNHGKKGWGDIAQNSTRRSEMVEARLLSKPMLRWQ
jgi:hypothetical protein